MNYSASGSPSARRTQFGAGSLIVVLVLFFVISLVAAYSNRNLIFEQKTSANQYRSTQAFETAEAGVEWALAMLNGGRIDNNCAASTTAETFRNRYLNFDAATGAQTIKVWTSGIKQIPFSLLCVRTTTAWSCNCPDSGAAVLTAPSGPAPAPAFRITFDDLSAGGRAGVITLVSRACTKLDNSCLGDPTSGRPAVGGPGDGVASMTVLLGLKGAISAAPLAALTAAGPVTLTGGTITNTEPLVNGVAVHSAGAIGTGPTLIGLPGSPGDLSTVANDSNLPVTAEPLFNSVFGISKTTYQEQPAAIVLTCPAECAAADLATLAGNNAGRVLWLVGDLDLSSPVTLGTATAPVVLVVNGNLTASAAATVYGLVYVIPNTGTTVWTTSGSLSVIGAVVSEGGVTGSATPNFRYDLGILNSLRLKSGSFVRVPGGWKDY
jgi:Tfp pilus assembly protein PilX